MKPLDRRTLSENKIGKAGAKKKPKSDKVAPVTTYIQQKIIDKVGGIEAARGIAKDAIERTSKPK